MLSSGYIMPTTSRPGKKFWNGRLSMQGEEQIVVMNTAHLIGNTNLKGTDAIKKFYKKDTRPDMIWQCWWCWKHDWQELARLSFVHWLADSATMKLPVFWCSNICYILLLFGLFEMMSSLLWKHKAIHFIKHSLMSFQLLVCCEIWLNTVLWVVNCLFAFESLEPYIWLSSVFWVFSCLKGWWSHKGECYHCFLHWLHFKTFVLRNLHP